MEFIQFIHQGNRIVRLAFLTHKLFYNPRDFLRSLEQVVNNFLSPITHSNTD